MSGLSAVAGEATPLLQLSPYASIPSAVTSATSSTNPNSVVSALALTALHSGVAQTVRKKPFSEELYRDGLRAEKTHMNKALSTYQLIVFPATFRVVSTSIYEENNTFSFNRMKAWSQTNTLIDHLEAEAHHFPSIIRLMKCLVFAFNNPHNEPSKNEIEQSVLQIDKLINAADINNPGLRNELDAEFLFLAAVYLDLKEDKTTAYRSCKKAYELHQDSLTGSFLARFLPEDEAIQLANQHFPALRELAEKGDHMARLLYASYLKEHLLFEGLVQAYAPKDFSPLLAKKYRSECTAEDFWRW